MTRDERSGGEARRSWGRAAREVKDKSGPQPGRGGHFRSHLEGWELGVVAVGIAAIAAALALPRGAEPEVFPLPHIDRKEAARLLVVERERAAEAERDTLPFEVRAVGETFRQYGRADADGDAAAASLKRAELVRLTNVARATAGDPALLRLRAVQTLLFVAALERYETGVTDTTELEELGGSFVQKAESSGWVRGSRRFDMTVGERVTLFRMRWSELTGLREESPFSPSANEWRTYYRFLLEHPEGGPSDELLRYVSAAEKYDSEYPAALARGIIELRLGRPARAIEPLTAHLAAKPSGRWRLRAQNHLARALAELDDGER